MTLLSELRKNQDAAIGADGLDSAEVTTIAQSAGLAVYTALDSLPSTNLTSGDQAWVESSGRLYISNGSGWYNVALINASPTLTLDQSGTIQLNADTLTVTVTASATDTDDNQDMITFSVESDGNMVGTGTTISQDSSVFTITADSEGGNGVAGNFTLTFKATDQIAVDNEDLSFSLSFSSIVDSSAPTVLLMKADGNSATNAVITYQNSSDASTGWTETGTPQAGTFSPYRSGGYSGYFTSTSNYLDLDFNAIGTNDFTIEAWVYITNSSANQIMCDFRPTSVDNTTGINIQFRSNNVLYAGSTSVGYITGTTTYSDHTWVHVALVRNGSTLTLYGNGVSQGSTSHSVNLTSTDMRIATNRAVTSVYNGFIRDFRLVNGTAVYTSNFTPPTEPLTAITNTEILTCHLPYFADGSTNDHSITAAGSASTLPFGPYDYEPWVGDTHSGSVFFDGTDDVLTSATNITSIAAGNYTVEFWYYPTKNLTDQQTLVHFNSGSNGGTNIWYGGSSGANIRVDSGLVGQSSFTDVDLILNAWHHIAITRSSTTTKCYINGKLAGSHSYTPNASNRVVLGRFTATPYYANGYYADFRYVPGSVVYSAEFTPPTAPLSHISNTDLLMNNKSDANVYDAAAANKLTLAGDTISSTTQRKFTTSSAVYLDGTGDYIDTDTSELFAFGTKDFTWEMWIYHTVYEPAYHLYWGTGSDHSIHYATSQGHLTYYTPTVGASSTLYTTGFGSMSVNTWYHIAVVRQSGTTYLYKDGVLQTSASDTTDYGTSANSMRIGASGADGTYPYTGYIQDLRITKGYARYTGAFTPPTAEFEL